MLDYRKILIGSVVLAASFPLAACQTTAPGYDAQSGKINTVMERAAAGGQGQSEESLALLEQMYKRNGTDPGVALRYAQALRQAGYYNRASLVLTPFATDEDTQDAALITEYAAIQSTLGNYVEAESYARKAVLLNPESGKAYHVLGIALDAQSHYEQANVAFDKALDHWEGDPSPVLNNIGLNLAAQGFLDEAIETLRKALDTAPDRAEIERNLRIVSALLYQPPKEGMRLVPVPPRKPSKDAVEASSIEEQPVEPVEEDPLAE